MGKTIAEINQKIEILKHAKKSFYLAKEKLIGGNVENYICAIDCNLAIELIDKEIDYLENYMWK
jgi:hypothetical protein